MTISDIFNIFKQPPQLKPDKGSQIRFHPNISQYIVILRRKLLQEFSISAQNHCCTRFASMQSLQCFRIQQITDNNISRFYSHIKILSAQYFIFKACQRFQFFYCVCQSSIRS